MFLPFITTWGGFLISIDIDLKSGEILLLAKMYKVEKNVAYTLTKRKSQKIYRVAIMSDPKLAEVTGQIVA